MIEYNDGITADHVMASGSLPVKFEYAQLDIASYHGEGSKNRVKGDIGTKNRDVSKNKIGSGSKSVTDDDR